MTGQLGDAGLLKVLTGQDVTHDITPPPEHTYRWATVVDPNNIRIRLDGESKVLEATPEVVSGDVLATGDRVWVQFYNQRVTVIGKAHPRGSVRDWMFRSQFALVGGGIRTTTANSISWGNRFIVIGTGGGRVNNGIIPAGYHEITFPPNGTVIPVHASWSGPVTVSGSKITFPRDWLSLWYEVPLGNPSASTANGNFHLLDWWGAYTIPDNWVMIAQYIGDPNTPAWKWGDGVYQDYWRPLPAFQNGWTAYETSGVNEPPGWRWTADRKMQLRGLVKGGTAGSTICSFSSFLAPDYNIPFSVPTATAPGLAWIHFNGNVVHSSGSTTWLSLAPMSWNPKGT